MSDIQWAVGQVWVLGDEAWIVECVTDFGTATLHLISAPARKRTSPLSPSSWLECGWALRQESSADALTCDAPSHPDTLAEIITVLRLLPVIETCDVCRFAIGNNEKLPNAAICCHPEKWRPDRVVAKCDAPPSWCPLRGVR